MLDTKLPLMQVLKRQAASVDDATTKPKRKNYCQPSYKVANVTQEDG